MISGARDSGDKYVKTTVLIPIRKQVHRQPASIRPRLMWGVRNISPQIGTYTLGWVMYLEYTARRTLVIYTRADILTVVSILPAGARCREDGYLQTLWPAESCLRK